MDFISNSVSETIKIGRIIARSLRQGDLICLWGKLGSGKTVLTKGIACGLGIDKDKVISPTFVLIRQHLTKRKLPFYHFDFYRILDCGDISGLGADEYFFGNGISVIEWPDRLKYLLPEEFLKIELSVKGTSSRRLKISAKGARYQELLKEINENIRH